MKNRVSLRTSFTFIALFFSVLAISCANRGSAAADSKTPVAVIDDEARILGGLAPRSTELQAKLEKTDFREFSEATQTDWETRPNLQFTPSISAQDRLNRISEWASAELRDFNTQCDTLLHLRF